MCVLVLIYVLDITMYDRARKCFRVLCVCVLLSML